MGEVWGGQGLEDLGPHLCFSQLCPAIIHFITGESVRYFIHTQGLVNIFKSKV